MREAPALPLEETLRSALAGDEASLRRLAGQLIPIVQRSVAIAVMKMTSRASGDRRQLTLDISQEVMIALFSDGARALRGWNPEKGSPFPRFVGMIAQRRTISALRTKDHQRYRLADDLAEIDEIASTRPPQEARASSRQELGRVLQRLQSSLSPKGLDIFYRLFVDDEPIDEVARGTGMTPNALYIWKTRLAKLLAQLQCELAASTEERSAAVQVPRAVDRGLET